MAAMVVQLGLATMPLGIGSRGAWALTSGTTSGTSGSMRQAEELSIDDGAGGGERGAPAPATRPRRPRRGRCRGRSGRPWPASSTTISVPFHGSVRPADRAEAKKRSSSTGKLRSSSSGSHHAADLAGGADDTDAHGRPGYRRPTDAPGSGFRRPEVRTSLAALGQRGASRPAPSRGRRRCAATRSARSMPSAAITTRDADRRGRDHLDVDALVGQHPEHLGGDAGAGLHAGADEARPWRCRRRGVTPPAPISRGHVAARSSRPRPCRPSAR